MSHSGMEPAICSWAPLISESLPAPHFAYSPVVRSGSFIFVSGLIGLNPENGRLIEGGLASEADRIFKNLKGICDDLGISVDQLMLARIYCADFSQFDVFNAIWSDFFKERTPPARTSIGVSALPLGALIEMEFQFAI